MDRRLVQGNGAGTARSGKVQVASRQALSGSSLQQGWLSLQRSAGNAATCSVLQRRRDAVPVVQRSIEWSRSWQLHLWKDQVAKGQIPTSQRPDDPKAQMRDAVLAAAKANPDNVALVAAVQDVAEFDVGAIDSLAKVRSGKGLLTFPTEGAPENSEYFAAEAARKKAKAGGYVDIQSGIHISVSCTKPHMTIDVYGADSRSTRYHLVLAWEGGAWKYQALERT